MAMKTPLAASTSQYGNRSVTIEVTGVCCQDVAKTSNYTVTVPHTSMLQTVQNIKRMGGKIANVNVTWL